jgi:hypothetical protein
MSREHNREVAPKERQENNPNRRVGLEELRARRDAYVEQQRMLASRDAGLRGVNYDPDETYYDEAFGPEDRVRRPLQNRLDIPSDYGMVEERMNERRAQGEN